MFRLWPLLTFDLHGQDYRFNKLNPYMTFAHPLRLNLSCLQGLKFRLLLTSEDLWPPPILVAFMWIYQGKYAFILIIFNKYIHFELSCLKLFRLWTMLNSKWQLTSIEKNIVLALKKADLHTKYEVHSPNNFELKRFQPKPTRPFFFFNFFIKGVGKATACEE